MTKDEFNMVRVKKNKGVGDDNLEEADFFGFVIKGALIPTSFSLGNLIPYIAEKYVLIKTLKLYNPTAADILVSLYTDDNGAQPTPFVAKAMMDSIFDLNVSVLSGISINASAINCVVTIIGSVESKITLN